MLAIQTENPVAQERLFWWMQRTYRRIQYYDAKIPFPIRYDFHSQDHDPEL